MGSKDVIDVRRMLRERGVCVVVPTYNNAGTIGRVIADVKRYCDDIIVVNDGCTDGTAAILHDILDITVIGYSRNMGKGYALKTAFRRALDMGFAYAITIDGDGQHLAGDIPAFLEANMKNPDALIVGSRDLNNKPLSKGARFANSFSNFWFCLQTWHYLNDTQTGYRLYPLKKLYGLSLLTDRYEAELELLVFTAWHGVRIVPIPIEVVYPADRVSHFRPAADFARISVLNTILTVLSLVYGLPLRIMRVLWTFLRTLYAALFFFPTAFLVLVPATLICTIAHRRDGVLNRLIFRLSRFVMIVHGIPGVKFRCDVSSDIDFNKPRVVICNHQSHIDLMLLLIFTPKIVFMTNDRAWKSPFYGYLIRHAGYLRASDGLDALMPQMRDLIAKGYNIAVFPEGSRSRSGRIERFHKGAFYIARELNIDILPIVLYGPGTVFPRNTVYLHRGTVAVEAGDPITLTELEQMGDLRVQSIEVHRRYVGMYADLKNKIDRNV